MKLGIYPGSFNPPHDGHFKVIKFLLTHNYVDKILVLPTPNYSTKQNLINIKDRLNMLKFYKQKNVIVDDIHNNYPYTYQVLKSIENDYPNDTLYLIIGSDNLKDFDKWKNVDKILKHKVIVMNRNDNINNIYKYIEKLGKEHFIIVENFESINISSTEIRKGIRDFVNKKILTYIKEHNLYNK